MKKNTLGKITALLVIAFGAWLGAICQNKQEKVNDMTQTKQTEKILFINGSPNRGGNTASLAQTLLEGKTYETLNLNDYRLNFYGQTLQGDKLDKVVERMKTADIIVMGAPVYWHNICASMRTLMERFYGYIPENTFKGKRLLFVYQGAAPTKMMIDDGEYTMSRFAAIYGFTYEGMATNRDQAERLKAKLD